MILAFQIEIDTFACRCLTGDAASGGATEVTEATVQNAKVAAVTAAGVVEVAVREAGEMSDAAAVHGKAVTTIQTSNITIQLTSLSGSGTGALITGSPTSIHGINSLSDVNLFDNNFL